MIESALVTLLMFALLFLMMDLALVVFIKATLQNAVKEGVRFGITGRNLQGQQYLNDSILKVVQDNSLGMLAGSSGGCKVTIKYYDPYTGAPRTNPAGNVLEVSVDGYQFTPVGAIFRDANPLSISARSSDIMETCPVGGCPAAQNPSPAPCN